MARRLEEWIGATPDTVIPPRVRLRVLRAYDSLCAACRLSLYPGCAWELDHKKRLADGGENRETNLQPLCVLCHVRKTSAERTRAAKADRIAKKHHGIKRRQARPMPGTKASGIKKPLGGGPPIDRETGEEL